MARGSVMVKVRVIVRTPCRRSVRVRNAGKCQYSDNSLPRASARIMVRTARRGSVRVCSTGWWQLFNSRVMS